MSDIVLTKISGDFCASDPVPACTTFTIRNFSSVDFELCTPVGDFPIPELKDTCNILVKAEGNRLVIAVAWTMKDESCSVVSGSCINTVQQQLSYILNTLQPNSIEDEFNISIDGISRDGSIRKWSFGKSETTPVTYSARIEFIAGDVVAGES